MSIPGDSGLARDMGRAGIVYELLGRPHHHLICLSCGRVTDLDDSYLAPLRDALYTGVGFKARIDHMAIYGLCADCASAEHSEPDHAQPG